MWCSRMSTGRSRDRISVRRRAACMSGPGWRPAAEGNEPDAVSRRLKLTRSGPPPGCGIVDLGGRRGFEAHLSVWRLFRSVELDAAACDQQATVAQKRRAGPDARLDDAAGLAPSVLGRVVQPGGALQVAVEVAAAFNQHGAIAKERDDVGESGPRPWRAVGPRACRRGIDHRLVRWPPPLQVAPA